MVENVIHYHIQQQQPVLFLCKFNIGGDLLGVTNAAGRYTIDFNFDTYAAMDGYTYSYNKSTKLETITYNGNTFATRQNVKNSDGSWTIATTCSPLNFSSVKKWTKDASGNWSAPDV